MIIFALKMLCTALVIVGVLVLAWWTILAAFWAVVIFFECLGKLLDYVRRK